MAPQYFVQSLFALSGILSLLAALCDWDWFFTTRNMHFLVSRIGRTKARIVYGLLGVVLIGMAVYFFYATQAG